MAQMRFKVRAKCQPPDNYPAPYVSKSVFISFDLVGHQFVF